MKKIFIFLGIFLLYNTLTQGQTTFTLNNINYVTKNDSTVTVTKGSSGMYVNIPSSVYFENKKYTVTAIGDSAFLKNGSMQSISLPETLKSIGVKAFYGCSGLSSIILPDSLTSISDRAFMSCRGLTNINIPNSVLKIGEFAFIYCDFLEKIEIPISVSSIGLGAFYSCYSLTAVNVDPNNLNYSSNDGVLYNKDKTILLKCPDSKSGNFDIPSSVKIIEESAFYQCAFLTNITIPSSVTDIKNFSFSKCFGLDSIYIPSNVSSISYLAFSTFNAPIHVSIDNNYYSSLDGVLYDKEKTTIIKCPESKTGPIRIPQSVTTIGSLAVHNCLRLTSINIPESVTEIEYRAFLGCRSLDTIYVYNPVPILLNPDDLIFGSVGEIGNIDTACILLVPPGSAGLYRSADVWKDFYSIKEFEVIALNSIVSNAAMSVNLENNKISVKNLKKSATLALYNLNGKEIFKTSISPFESVTLSNKLYGVYIVKVFTQESDMTQKILIL
ncbi:leucine-rich repeat domain-containing protein [Saccharicrinis sp. FJH62]|uniref:leucine-rich repeat domain-containing protein n=1 Tax=Saccharicrinis sp. FJH62 TaxID=3344657 RepID=UPI0035D42079